MNNSAFVIVILIAWWSIFFIGLENEWIWTIDIAILFLMLVSETTMIVWGSDKVLSISSLSLQRWATLHFLLWQSALWNKKQLEKVLINLDPGKNLLFKESKDEKIPLRQVLVSVTKLLIFECYLKVMFSKESQWEWELTACLFSRGDLITWLERRVKALNWSLPLGFWRCK